MVQIIRHLFVASILTIGIHLNYCPEAKANNQNIVNQENSIDSLINISSNLINSKPQEAVKTAKQALNRSQEEGSISNMARSRLALAAAYRQQRNFIGVLDALNPLLENLTELNNDSLIAEILNNIGIAHFQLDHDTLSLNVFIEEFDRQESDEDVKSLSKSLKNIGIFYLNTKNYKRAANFFMKSVRVDSTANDKSEFGISYYFLGKTAFFNNDTSTAVDYFKTALPLLSNSKKGKGLTYLAKIFFDIDKATSKNYIDLARPHLSQHIEPLFWHDLLILEGKIYADQQNFDKALLCLQKAKDLNINNKEELTKGYLFIAERMLSQNRIDNAFNCFLKAYKTAGESYKLKSESILGMAKIYNLQGKKQKANRMLWEYVDLSDSTLTQVISETKNSLNNPLNNTNLERKVELYQKDTKIQSLILEREKAKKRHFLILIIVLIPLLFFILVLYRDRTLSNKKLTEQNKQINQQVEELSAINEQLSLSREQLQNANSTKDKLFSIIAHDLKSPLVSLRTLLFTITSSTGKESYEHNNQLRCIESTLNTIIELLNNLLFWAMSQKEEISLNPQKFNVKEAVDTELKLAKNIARQKSIIIRTEIPENLKVSADKNMLLFVLRNLVSNAIKFTPEKGTIAVTVFEDKRNLTLRVKDTGIGIAPEMQNTIFDIDSTDKKEKKEGEGTGLGLTLCADFAKKMGGNLTVKSEINKGSQFSLTIPLNL